MKIPDTHLASAAASEVNKAHPAEAVPRAPQPGAESRPAAETDGVHLSELSGRLLEVVRGESPEQAARLERLAAEVQAGRHQVDPLAVSRRLVDEALEE